MPAELSLSSIAHVRVTSYDLERATAFYRDVLRMPFLYEFPGFAVFDCGGVHLVLAAPELPEENHPASVIAFRVEDIDEAYRILMGRGVKFLGPPQISFLMPDIELWLCRFHDADKNILTLRSDVRRNSRKQPSVPPGAGTGSGVPSA
jgi:methylmalonyl-CoA/ethylmalonyl-CoA epimerase